MAQARSSIVSPLRAATYHTLTGLLAASGMRIGEGIKLDRLMPTGGGLLIRESKFGKSRLVPLQSCSTAALQDYAQLRDQLQPRPTVPSLFVSLTGQRLVYAVVCHTFRRLVDNAGIGADASRPPRLLQQAEVRASVCVERDELTINDHTVLEVEVEDLGIGGGDLPVVAAVHDQPVACGLADGVAVDLDLERPPRADRNRTGARERRSDQLTRRRSCSRRRPVGHLRSVRRAPRSDHVPYPAQTKAGPPPRGSGADQQGHAAGRDAVGPPGWGGTFPSGWRRASSIMFAAFSSPH
jgi:Phage integrase family